MRDDYTGIYKVPFEGITGSCQDGITVSKKTDIAKKEEANPCMYPFPMN